MWLLFMLSVLNFFCINIAPIKKTPTSQNYGNWKAHKRPQHFYHRQDFSPLHCFNRIIVIIVYLQQNPEVVNWYESAISYHAWMWRTCTACAFKAKSIHRARIWCVRMFCFVFTQSRLCLRITLLCYFMAYNLIRDGRANVKSVVSSIVH